MTKPTKEEILAELDKLIVDAEAHVRVAKSVEENNLTAVKVAVGLLREDVALYFDSPPPPDEPPPPDDKPDLTRGLLFHSSETITAPIHLPAKDLLGIVTVMMVVKTRATGDYQKFLGAASSENPGQGALGIGVKKDFSVDCWRPGGGSFNQLQNPPTLVERKASLLEWEAVAGGEHRVTIDGVSYAEPLPLSLVAADGFGAVGEGLWEGRFVNPIVGEIRAISCWNEQKTDEEKALWRATYGDRVDDKPDDPPLPPPNGDPPSDLPPVSGPDINVRVGESISLAAVAAPENTRFLIHPGAIGTNIFPKHGQRFQGIGDTHVEIDGRGATKFMGGNDVHDVSLVNLKLRNFRPMPNGPNADGKGTAIGAIHPDADTCHRWRYRHVWLIDIKGRGITLGYDSELMDFLIEDTGHCSIAGPARNLRIENGICARANLDGYGAGWESGCIKLTGGRLRGGTLMPPRSGSVLRKLKLFDARNSRGGIWCDWDGTDTIVEDVLIDGVDFEGIVFEAWRAATLRRVTIKNANRRTKSNGLAIWNAIMMLQNTQKSIIEECEIYVGRDAKAVFGIAQHDRGATWPTLGKNEGQTIGPFYGMWNIIRNNNLVWEKSGVPLSVIDVNATTSPPKGEVIASNKFEGNV